MFDVNTYLHHMIFTQKSAESESIGQWLEMHGVDTNDPDAVLRFKWKETSLYRDYLKRFKVKPLVTLIKQPEFVDRLTKKEMALLLRLVAASFSSTYELKAKKKKIHLMINIRFKDKSATKRFHDLFGFQIQRMFEIYMNEQINLDMISSDKVERDIVLSQREDKIESFAQQAVQVSLALALSKPENRSRL